MKLYHGSYMKIVEIDLAKAKPYKDFGRAFYLTKFYEQAKTWADRLSREHGIVEGPIADDKVQNRIIDYLNGEITKTDFLEELKWHEETHQICFCTVASLQFLQQADRSKLVSKLLHIGEPIVEKLVIDFGLDEKTATNNFFSSNTFLRLADTSNHLYEKTWIEIYKLLLNELKA